MERGGHQGLSLFMLPVSPEWESTSVFFSSLVADMEIQTIGDTFVVDRGK